MRPAAIDATSRNAVMTTRHLREEAPQADNPPPQDATIMFIHAMSQATTDQARAFVRAAAGACRLALN